MHEHARHRRSRRPSLHSQPEFRMCSALCPLHQPRCSCRMVLRLTLQAMSCSPHPLPKARSTTLPPLSAPAGMLRVFSRAALACELRSEWKRPQKQCKWQRCGRRGRAFSNGPLMTCNMASHRCMTRALHLRFMWIVPCKALAGPTTRQWAS